MITEKEETKLKMGCLWGVVIFIALAMMGVIGCGAKMVNTQTNRINKKGYVEIEHKVKTNYTGTFEAKLPGGIVLKGKKIVVEYPDLNFFRFNFGTKEKK